jgi:putative endonuclease
MNKIVSEISDSAAIASTANNWAVYMICADDQRLYTGITNDVARRWRQHSAGSGAKFFRGRKPQALVFVEVGHDRASALRREAAIKKLSRTAKLALIAVPSSDVQGFVAAIKAEKQTADTPEDVPAAKG